LTADELAHEVIPSDVLSKEEVGADFISIAKKEKPKGLREISIEIVPRTRLNTAMKPVRNVASGSVRKETCELKLTKLDSYDWSDINWQYKCTIRTKSNVIELLPLVCHKFKVSDTVASTTSITKVVNPDSPNSASASEPTVLTFREHVEDGAEFRIPLAVGGRDISLQPDTEYRVEMSLCGYHRQYYSRDRGSGSHSNQHLTLDIPRNEYGGCRFPSDKLQYRVVT